MTALKPSLDLLRELSDEHVLRALMDAQRMTRAELAAATGISKPTVGESVRRLTEAGVLHDTGERTTGRGRVGTYYAIADDVGSALAVDIAPEGIVAETVDVRGQVLARAVERVSRPTRPARVAAALGRACDRAQAATPAPARLAVVSAADPVDRTTGRLVHLPDAPFLLGELSPGEVLSGRVGGPVLVDNDVNWAARAERDASATALDDFVYVYLGEGLGCAVVADGTVLRGHGGLAGETAHVLTTGPGGRAMAFTQVFAELGLRHEASTAIDVDALLAAADATDARARRVRQSLGRAVSGVLAAAVALADPSVIVIGGRWGRHHTVFEAIVSAFAELPRRVPLRPATVTDEAPLTGARANAVGQLRTAIVNYRRDLLRSSPGH